MDIGQPYDNGYQFATQYYPEQQLTHHTTFIQRMDHHLSDEKRQMGYFQLTLYEFCALVKHIRHLPQVLYTGDRSTSNLL